MCEERLYMNGRIKATSCRRCRAMKVIKPKSLRIAISFDPEMFNYYSRMCRDRNEAFSATVASILREVMRDDVAHEMMNAEPPSDAAH